MIGRAFSHYKILKKLGEGGMGVVYQAQDTKLDRLVALKFLPAALGDSPEERGRFQQEARTLSRLNHANIATVHDIDEADGERFIVLEYLSGGTLKSKIEVLDASEQFLTFQEIVEYAIRIGEGLAHAHRNGIVHRDLKTDNIMLTEDGNVKITDFGLAKLRGGEHLTRSGSTLGTPGYMSPEQVRGEEIDERSDLFSFGVVLYELLTAHLPFRGEHYVAMGYSIAHEDPVPPSTYRTDIPSSLGHILNRALEKDRGKRYQKAAELVAELRKIRLDGPSLASKEGQPSETINSIAVLPFINMSADPENEYFSDGISEEIINALTKVRSLLVAARTSSFAFKGKTPDIKSIAQALQVKSVLEGSVRKAGKKIRITAQLISVADGYHLWSERYDRDLEDIFAIQDEISLAVVDALRVKLLGGEHEALTKRHTENPQAYELYLRARHSFYRRTVDDLKASIRWCEQAIALEPDFALPHSGLADALLLLSYTTVGVIPPREAFPRAIDAARRAVELDNTLAEAHTSLGFAHLAYGWDWVRAEEEFKKAIALNPRYSLAQIWYATLLTQQGRHQESAVHAQTAQYVDPFSPFMFTLAGLLTYCRREYDKAIEQIQRALDLAPNYWLPHLYLGYAYYSKGLHKEAAEAIQRARVLSGDSTNALVVYGNLSARTGDLAAARTALQTLLQRREESYVLPGWIAGLYFDLNDHDKAVEWMQLALRERDSLLTWLGVIPMTDPYKSDKDIAAILDKVGPEL